MNITLDEVTKRFGERQALGPLSLRLSQSGLTVVGGPNGAGKSVLLKVLAGVLAPTSGRILWDGLPVSKHLAAYKFRLGYMPQEPTFYEDQSVLSTLRYFARLKAIPSPRVRRRVEEVLHLTRLVPCAKRRVRHLSGGERSRLAVGVALLNDPDLLLLDEPGTNLDPSERLLLWELIGGMKRGRAIVMATHLFAGLEGSVDRLLLLDAGRAVLDAPVDELLGRVAPFVWEVGTPAGARPTWSAGTHVVSRRMDGERVVWRLLAPERPLAGAERAEPTLEEAYLWVRRR